LDCAQALLALGKLRMDEAAIDETLGCISKSVEDGVKIRDAGVEKLLVRGS
jgi:hypothetical protein